MQRNVTTIHESCRHVGEYYFGSLGRWLYDCFDEINRQLFDNRLPQPLIIPTITAWGGCLGLTRSLPGHQPPTIVIHPACLGGRYTDKPWNIPPEYLGPSYAFDVLIHESIHVGVNYVLGGSSGESSHNCDEWIGEVNRIAPQVGITDLIAARNKTKRVRVGDKSKVQRVCDGNVSFRAAARFPHAVRRERNEFGYYAQQSFPAWMPESLVTRSDELHIR